MSSPLTHPCVQALRPMAAVSRQMIFICKEGIVFALFQPLAQPFSHLEGSQRPPLHSPVGFSVSGFSYIFPQVPSYLWLLYGFLLPSPGWPEGQWQLLQPAPSWDSLCLPLPGLGDLRILCYNLRRQIDTKALREEWD